MQKLEKFLSAQDGIKMHLTVFLPDDPPKAAILFVHGLGEFAGAYSGWAERFTSRGAAVFFPDLRGHGKTPGKRGVMKSFGEVLNDIAFIKQLMSNEYPELPQILYGYSMGGNIALNYLLRRDSSGLACAVAGSPWLALYRPYPLPAYALVRAAGAVLPSYTMRISITPEHLTNDRTLLKSGITENLFHGRLSAKAMGEITEAGKYAVAHANEVSIPLLVLKGSDDRLISTGAIDDFCASSNENVTLCAFEGQRHQLHSDTRRDEVFETIWSFITKYTNLRM